MRVFVVGDVYLGRRLNEFSRMRPELVFQGIREHVLSSDLSVFNLEGPITNKGTQITKTGPNLKMAPGAEDFLRNAGFQLATLANNHIFDFGEPGLSETISRLGKVGLNCVGAGRSLEKARAPYILELEGRSVGILNFAENEWSTTHSNSAGANPIDPVKNFRDIDGLTKRVDRVVVITHGGHEFSKYPTPAMRDRMRFYVEAGAHAVLNHHQHIVSGFERYRGAPIFYGLGNCLFDSGAKASEAWYAGLGVTLTFTAAGVDFELHHFNQCGAEPRILPCSEGEAEQRTLELNELNGIIADDDLLEHHSSEEFKARANLYRSYLYPIQNRYIQALHNRGLLPSFLSDKKKRLYLNLIRCESHREALISLLGLDTSE